MLDHPLCGAAEAVASICGDINLTAFHLPSRPSPTVEATSLIVFQLQRKLEHAMESESHRLRTENDERADAQREHMGRLLEERVRSPNGNVPRRLVKEAP